MVDLNNKLKIVREKINKKPNKIASSKKTIIDFNKPNKTHNKISNKYKSKAITNCSKINSDMKLDDYLEQVKYIKNEDLLPKTPEELKIINYYNAFFNNLKGISSISNDSISRIYENSLQNGYEDKIKYKFRNNDRELNLKNLPAKASLTNEMLETLSKVMFLPKYAQEGTSYEDALKGANDSIPYLFEAIYKSSSIEKIIKMTEKWHGGDKDYISSLGYVSSKEFKWQNLTNSNIKLSNDFTLKEINNQKELNGVASILGNCIAAKGKDCLGENPNFIFSILDNKNKITGAIQAEYNADDECIEVVEQEDNEEYETGAYLEQYLYRFFDRIEIDNSLKEISEYKNDKLTVNIDRYKDANKKNRENYTDYEIELGFVPYGEEGLKSHFSAIKNHREYLGSGREKNLKNKTFQSPDKILKSLEVENGKSLLSLYYSNFETRSFPKIQKMKSAQSAVS